MREHEDKQVLCFVLSVPVVHLPKLMARFASRVSSAGEDFSDRWSSGAHVRDRNWLLHRLYEHQRRVPSQHVVLLSGDIHIGCVHKITWDDGGGAFYQVISSPITHLTGRAISLASEGIIRINRSIHVEEDDLKAKVHILRGEAGHRKNPYGRLNLGLVEIETPTPHARPRLRFYLYGHEGEEPVCVYRSPFV